MTCSKKLVAVNRVAKVVKGRQNNSASPRSPSWATVPAAWASATVKAREVAGSDLKGHDAGAKEPGHGLIEEPIPLFLTRSRDGMEPRGCICSRPPIGTGVIAGGGMRAVFECAGVRKRAREELRLAQPDQRGARPPWMRSPSCAPPDDIAAKRGKSVAELVGLNGHVR